MPKVTVESSPWGDAYEVSFGPRSYHSSADGTLWYVNGGGFASFTTSELCRLVVRIARLFRRVERKPSRWPGLLDTLPGDMREDILAGGLKGQEDARKSGLLP